MAYASAGSLGADISTSSSSSVTVAVSANVSAGDILVALVASDNVQTTDGASTLVSSVTDSQGNTWTKVGEFTNGNASAAAGATVAAFFCNVVTPLNTFATDGVSANFAQAIVSKAISVWRFTGSAAMANATTATLATDAAVSPGSLALSGLASLNRIYVRAIAKEWNSATLTTSASFTAFSSGVANTGTSATSMSVAGEFRINTSTGETSNPSFPSGSGDHASLFFALEVTSNVSLALTGNSATASRGTLTPTNSITATGNSATASGGTVSPSLSVTPTGQSGALSGGSLTVALSKALTGQSNTASGGTLTPDTSTRVALTGLQAAMAGGSLSPALSAALTGAAATLSQGSLTQVRSVTLAGAASSVTAGSLTPGTFIIFNSGGQFIVFG